MLRRKLLIVLGFTALLGAAGVWVEGSAAGGAQRVAEEVTRSVRIAWAARRATDADAR